MFVCNPNLLTPCPRWKHHGTLLYCVFKLYISMLTYFDINWSESGNLFLKEKGSLLFNTWNLTIVGMNLPSKMPNCYYYCQFVINFLNKSISTGWIIVDNGWLYIIKAEDYLGDQIIHQRKTTSLQLYCHFEI